MMDLDTISEYFLFFSRSKNLPNRYMSNFTIINGGGITIPESFPIKNMIGYKFNSIENAFQASKYGLIEDINGIKLIQKSTPNEAKSLGSKSGMKKQGKKLDTPLWNSMSYIIMQELVRERMKIDELYRLIAKNCKMRKIPIKHFERNGSKSFWGGCYKNGEWVGYNALGRIITETVNEFYY